MRHVIYKSVALAIFAAIFSFGLQSSPVKGQENTRPQDMARYYPATVQGFASFQIDEASFDQLDRIVKLALSPFARSVPQLSFREVFLAATGKNADEMASWLGV